MCALKTYIIRTHIHILHFLKYKEKVLNRRHYTLVANKGIAKYDYKIPNSHTNI